MKLEVLSDKEERFIARKLSSLMTMQLNSKGNLKKAELREVAIVKELYSGLITYC